MVTIHAGADDVDADDHADDGHDVDADADDVDADDHTDADDDVDAHGDTDDVINAMAVTLLPPMMLLDDESLQDFCSKIIFATHFRAKNCSHETL